MELAAMADLNLTLFGGFEARRGSGAVVDLPGQKERALLAYLAMTPGDAHPRERLAGLLWSERGDRQARDSLKQALMRLRRCLEASDGGALRADRQSVALKRAAVSVDVLAFERFIRDGTVDALAQAIAIYRGDLLEGIAIHDQAFENWLLVERQRLRQLLERALADLMAQALDGGDAEKAADAARRLLLLDPLSEAAYRTLMRVHADQGQTAQALKLYEALRERLRRELGVLPEPATAALYERIRLRRPPADDTLPAPPETTLPEAKPSIAVLPFVNLSGDPEQQYFSDGITEDIITELSRFRTLFVIARHSSFQYRGGATDVTRIGRELGVRYLVEGSVRRLGERLRISAQLIEAASGAHLWAEHYDREAADILAVQDEIVSAIATTLGDRIDAAGRERALRLSPDALSAYDNVLRSEAHLLRFTKHENAEARRLAQKAVALDPQSAVAHAQLGWTHGMDHLFGWVEDRAQTLETALALARRGILLDAADGRSRSLLGFVHIFRREYDEAGAQLRWAVTLNPNDVEARGIYGVYLIAIGDAQAALEQFDIAKRNNPFETNWIIDCRGVALFTARRYDDAIATLRQVPSPTYETRCWLAASYAAVGRQAEARAALAEFLAIAEREMARFPGLRLADWEPELHRLAEFRDQAEFDHLHAALRAAGLQ
jgi:TolB-like protein/DNA-binding SARP family transcriptional activator/Flp pilus assembly protein TadD